MTDRPEQQDEGGYYFTDDPADSRNEEVPTVPETEPPNDSDPEPRRSFKRVTPARVKTIRPEPPRGRWGLVIWTVLYVMLSASAADYLPVGVRMTGHVLFWLAIGGALLVRIQRERRHGWESGARWPWAVALISGTLAVELLVATVSSLVTIIGSAVVLSVGLMIVLMLG